MMWSVLDYGFFYTFKENAEWSLVTMVKQPSQHDFWIDGRREAPSKKPQHRQEGTIQLRDFTMPFIV